MLNLSILRFIYNHFMFLSYFKFVCHIIVEFIYLYLIFSIIYHILYHILANLLASTLVHLPHPRCFGGVRVANPFTFLCCYCFACLRSVYPLLSVSLVCSSLMPLWFSLTFSYTTWNEG